MRRDQSEDYVRTEDVMVLRDTGVRGVYAQSRAVDEFQLGVAVRQGQMRRQRIAVVEAKRVEPREATVAEMMGLAPYPAR